MWTPVSHPVEDYFTVVFSEVVSRVILARMNATSERRDLFAPILYTIDVTPGRKFRSALPIVLSRFARSTILVGAAIEILWAAYTILDDLAEQQRSRYGCEAAWVKFGAGRAAYSLPVAITCVHELLSEASIPSNCWLDVAAALDISYYAQLEHHTWDLMVKSVPEYLDLAERKVRFVTALWSFSMRVVGYDLLAALLPSVHRQSAIAGQIKNDLYNIWPAGDHPGTCSDIITGAVTYPLLRFRDAASKADIETFLRYWKSGLMPHAMTDIVQLRGLFDRYGILSECNREVASYTEQAWALIRKAGLEKAAEDLLTGWLNLQLEHDMGIAVTGWQGEASKDAFPTIPQDS